ncbi:MAG: U32 family peptidase [Desulfovibrionaceae bacterium]|nr:U32 family peptidase [Desulfovibrionaceae bacterium]
MPAMTATPRKPEILAPAGDMPCFLAALAAGADAVYLGLKNFSARMQADNFSTSDLSRMVELANAEHRRIYVAFNTLAKPNEPETAARLIARLVRDAPPHGLIVQDPGMLALARAAGYKGGLFLSTLSNITHPMALESAARLGADRVVLPRELSIDEVRQMDAACPDGMDFEFFVHGALCWCVSGRCYWSSYMGGKSGLRGRCVQPCRRMYRQQKHAERSFSCLDYSLDVLVKATLDIPHIASWKIEGRKKGPHYVYHTALAYRILRDEGADPQARREAVKILEMSLGRKTTRAHFLPQRDSAPTQPDAQTSSGLLAGKIHIDAEGRPSFKPHLELLPGDYLRVGYEDEAWHATLPVSRRVPKAGTLCLRLAKHKTPRAGTPVFLIDRREPELMRLIAEWQAKLNACRGRAPANVSFTPTWPRPAKARRRPDMLVRSSVPHGTETRRSRTSVVGLWLTARSVREVSRTVAPDMAWWLPPVIWPNEEDAWKRTILEARRNGARHFVCNAPWQAAFFAELPAAREPLDLIAGPFCNLANAFAIEAMARLGFSAAFVSPELSGEDFLALPAQSPLPLGMVLGGFWPMGIGRHAPEGIKPGEPFQSPKGESFWTRKFGQNTWVFPAWPLDLSAKKAELEAAGYSFFAQLDDAPPKTLAVNPRPGLFNWDGRLL